MVQRGISVTRAPLAVLVLLVAVATVFSAGRFAVGASPAFTYVPIAANPIGTNEAQSVVVGDQALPVRRLRRQEVDLHPHQPGVAV